MKIFAHRYKYSHASLRSVLQRALRRGSVTLIETTPEGWIYEISHEIKKELKL